MKSGSRGNRDTRLGAVTAHLLQQASMKSGSRGNRDTWWRSVTHGVPARLNEERLPREPRLSSAPLIVTG